MDTIIGERLTKLAKLVESEDDSEQDEIKDLLAKVPCNMVTIDHHYVHHHVFEKLLFLYLLQPPRGCKGMCLLD